MTSQIPIYLFLTFLLLVAVASVGCRNIKRNEAVTSATISQVTFKVVGMMKTQSGAT